MRRRARASLCLGIVLLAGSIVTSAVQAKRRRLVWEIQKKLEADVARPMLGWRIEYFTQWPYVRNLVAHHSLYNWGRMQDVWLDK